MSVLIKNIYHMLSYAFSALNQGEYEDVSGEDFENIHNLFAAILTRGIGRLLKQGLYREYQNCEDDLPLMRGKIDVPGTIKNRMARKRLIRCEYDELSENNTLNQILKTTGLVLLNANVDARLRSNLKREMLFFSNVDTIDLGALHWDSICFNRNNKSYHMLIHLCRMLAEGMLITNNAGEYKIASFMDDQRMCRLYEKFLLEYFRHEWPQIKVTTPQIQWEVDDGVKAMLPVMQSDVVLSVDNTFLIIDAKYYSHATQTRFGTHTLHSDNLYQIYTYVKNFHAEHGCQTRTVSGMLLYAGTDEDVQPDCSYRMSGNRISVKSLDMNRPFQEIAATLDEVVRDHFQVNR